VGWGGKKWSAKVCIGKKRSRNISGGRRNTRKRGYRIDEGRGSCLLHRITGKRHLGIVMPLCFQKRKIEKMGAPEKGDLASQPLAVYEQREKNYSPHLNQIKPGKKKRQGILTQ